MLMLFRCRLIYVNASKDSISAFFRVAASRPYGPPVLWLGEPLKAAAGQATAAKLQNILGLQSHRKPSIILQEASVQG